MHLSSAAGQFVGRSEELATFAQLVETARSGSPVVVVVGGDAGIGKTTFLRETAARCGVEPLLGRSAQIARQPLPLAPIVDLIRQIARSARGEVLGNDRYAPLTGLGDHVAVTPDVVGGLAPSFLHLVTELARNEAIALGFEDLHWADETTWDLFEYVARSLVDERVVLVGTYRSSELGPERRKRLGELTRVPGTHHLVLGGLSRDEIEAQVAALMSAPPPPDLVDELMRRAQGNPFFTAELVAAHARGESLPPLLADLLAGGLASCGRQAREVLDVLATIARDTPHDLLAAVLGRSDADVEAGAREAIAAELITVDAETGRFRFRHPLIAEVVYRAMLPSERSRLHARVAKVLRERRAPGAALDTSELAFHLDKAGDRPAALAASLVAADAAEQLAPAVALGHLERALALWDDGATDGAERLRRLWQCAELASATGANARAAELARSALGEGPPPQGYLRAYERLGRYLWAQGRLEESAEAYAQAVGHAEEDGDSSDAAAAFAGLAQADLMRCRFGPAADWSHRALSICAGGGAPRAVEVAAQHILALVHSQRGEHETAIELCLAAARPGVDVPPHVHLLAVVYLVMALMDAGEFQAAGDAAQDGQVEAERAGLGASYAAYLAGAAAECFVRLGQWPEVESVLHTVAGRTPIPIAATRIDAARALLAARRGEASAARLAIESALGAPVGPYHRALATATVAEAYLALGLWADAYALGTSLVETSGPIHQSRLAALCTTAGVEANLDAKARGEPPVAATAALERWARVAAPGSTRLERAHLCQAVAVLAGANPAAWGKAAAAWEEVGDPWSLAWARAQHADAAVRASEYARAADSLHAAYRSATGLGARQLAALVESIATRHRMRVDEPPRPRLRPDTGVAAGLTPREAEVLGLVAAGFTNRAIGEKLFVSEKTASVHVSNILRKLGVASRIEAAALAQRSDISARPDAADLRGGAQ